RRNVLQTHAVLHGADGRSLALRFSSIPPASPPPVRRYHCRNYHSHCCPADAVTDFAAAVLLAQGAGELRSLTLTPYPPTICRVIAAR
ncbi:MAG: hypothetical protein VZQ27_01695, partial [Candidatus Cryptobacteroides sp.]|nr:hypothetical protein [Candidatus Cryptobacteroides sp.]